MLLTHTHSLTKSLLHRIISTITYQADPTYEDPDYEDADRIVVDQDPDYEDANRIVVDQDPDYEDANSIVADQDPDYEDANRIDVDEEPEYADVGPGNVYQNFGEMRKATAFLYGSRDFISTQDIACRCKFTDTEDTNSTFSRTVSFAF